MSRFTPDEISQTPAEHKTQQNMLRRLVFGVMERKLTTIKQPTEECGADFKLQLLSNKNFSGFETQRGGYDSPKEEHLITAKMKNTF